LWRRTTGAQGLERHTGRARKRKERRTGIPGHHPAESSQDEGAQQKGTLEDLLANADKLAANMKGEFEAGTELRIKHLPEIFRAKWMMPATRAAAIEEFRENCHIIKGEAGTFGYKLLTQIADLFGDYVRDTPAANQRPEAIKGYIDAFTICWSQKIAGDGGDLGRALLSSLQKLNEKYTQGER
jgi:HPt (histidine-containing phosphotransfer) domain-containing protein